MSEFDWSYLLPILMIGLSLYAGVCYLLSAISHSKRVGNHEWPERRRQMVMSAERDRHVNRQALVEQNMDIYGIRDGDGTSMDESTIYVVPDDLIGLSK